MCALQGAAVTHLETLKIQESAFDDEPLSGLTLVESTIVDLHDFKLEVALRSIVVGAEFHVCEEQLSIVVMLDVEIATEWHKSLDIFAFAWGSPIR